VPLLSSIRRNTIPMRGSIANTFQSRQIVQIDSLPVFRNSDKIVAAALPNVEFEPSDVSSVAAGQPSYHLRQTD
jgi:hypothetical protein